ncbi:immunity repressor [Gordonia phage Kiko]|nr:immunity repressor [Gordonia phage Kiko]
MTVQADAGGYVYPVWSFGDKVRKARAMAGMDQREFASAINTTAGSVAQWETDRSKPRDVVAVAKRIEVLTRVPATWLLGLDDDNRPGPDDGGAATQPAPNADKSSSCDSAGDAAVVRLVAAA